jgi:energy-coupling factor transporter ATP-binding protein EcfA2
MTAAPVLRASQLQRSWETFQATSVEVPRGALTEIIGPASSGRTSLLCSLLAAATARQEVCALLDTQNTFDLHSAADAGVRLSQLLWVRCNGNVEHALKAADMLANAGGFGMVAIDLGDTSDQLVHRIPLAAWFRLRHAVENTRTALVSLAQRSHAHPCSVLKVELRRESVLWGGYLKSMTAAGELVKSHRRQHVRLPFQR